MIKIVTRNVVCGGSVGAEIPMEAASRLPGTEYDPTSFPGVRFRAGGCTVLLFATGKIVSVGAVTDRGAFDAMDAVVNLLKANGIAVGNVTLRVHNVVATANIGSCIDLGRVVRVMPRSLYEPEHFPGVIIRRRDPKATILLFASGKLVCVGARSVDGASDAVNQLRSDLASEGLI